MGFVLHDRHYQATVKRHGHEATSLTLTGLSSSERVWLAERCPEADSTENSYHSSDDTFTLTQPTWPHQRRHGDRSISITRRSTDDTQDDGDVIIEYGGVSGSAEDEQRSADEDNEDDASSAERLPGWLLMQLSAAELRLVIDGLQFANGSVGKRQISTGDAAFRDQLMHALLHCGFSPLCSASTNAWSISWSDPAVLSDCSLSLSAHSGITSQPYSHSSDGRIWCVSVDHPDHLIVAQRATRLNGRITRQWRPLITGNCVTIADDMCEDGKGMNDMLEAMLDAVETIKADEAASHQHHTTTPAQPNHPPYHHTPHPHPHPPPPPPFPPPPAPLHLLPPLRRGMGTSAAVKCSRTAY